jgi:hypothetical protein
MELLHRGNQNRAVEPTKRNETSSRSHAVLQIVIDKEMKTAAIHKTILIGSCLHAKNFVCLFVCFDSVVFLLCHVACLRLKLAQASYRSSIWLEASAPAALRIEGSVCWRVRTLIDHY